MRRSADQMGVEAKRLTWIRRQSHRMRRVKDTSFKEEKNGHLPWGNQSLGKSGRLTPSVSEDMVPQRCAFGKTDRRYLVPNEKEGAAGVWGRLRNWSGILQMGETVEKLIVGPSEKDERLTWKKRKRGGEDQCGACEANSSRRRRSDCISRQSGD